MWVELAIQAATTIAKGYQQRNQKAQEDEALAGKIIEGVKKELSLVKNEIFHKLEDLQKEELQGILRGYLNNFELYKIGMPGEIDWLQTLIHDANEISGRMYVVFKRYLLAEDYYNSRDMFAMYLPVVSSYLYLLHELALNFNSKNEAVVLNLINLDILPGVADILNLLESYTRSRYSQVKEQLHAEPKPDEKLSIMVLYYEVIDGKGEAVDVNIMDYVKSRQLYWKKISAMRSMSIENELSKLKKQLGLEAYVDELANISGNTLVSFLS